MTCDGLGSNPGRGVSFQFGWTNGRYAMKLIFRTGAASEFMTLRRDTNEHIIIIIIIRRHRSQSAAAYSRQTFPWMIC